MAEQLWGGRFSKSTDEMINDFQAGYCHSGLLLRYACPCRCRGCRHGNYPVGGGFHRGYIYAECYPFLDALLMWDVGGGMI